MRHRIVRLVAVAALTCGSLAGFGATAASADGVAVCSGGQGIVHASPGLTNTPHAQTVGFAALLTACGSLGDGAVIVRFARTGPVTCADLQAGGESISGRLLVKWTAPHMGHSVGTITATLDSTGAAHITGTITKGTGAGSTFSTDAQLTPKFKDNGTPCTEANKLKWATFTLTSPLTVTAPPAP